MSEYQKLIYKEILKKKLIKILIFLVNIRNLILAVRYQRVYLNKCRFDQLYEGIQVRDAVK